MELEKLKQKYYHFQRYVNRLRDGLDGDLSNEIYLSGIETMKNLIDSLGSLET